MPTKIRSIAWYAVAVAGIALTGFALASPAGATEGAPDAAERSDAAVSVAVLLPTDIPEFPEEEWGPVLPHDEAAEPAPGADETAEEERPWWHFLPIGGQAARERGYELPLPYGVGANFVVLEQSMSVNEVRVGFAGGPLQEVGFVEVDDFKGTGKSLTTRFDAWLLPFLNVYGVVGYTWATSDVVVSIDNPLPARPPIRVPVSVDLEGPTYGGGMTVVGGYGPVFAMADLNYTYTDFDVFDSKIGKLTFSPRAGLQGKLYWFRGAFWLGAMYIDNEQTVELSERLGIPELDPLRIEVDQKSDKAWNFLIGGNWEISRAFQLTVEGGIGDRKQLLIGAGYRF
jgi:hypothetical protein